MQKNRLREYSYTILLGVSFVIVAAIWQFCGLRDQKPEEVSHFLQDATDDLFSWILLERSVKTVSAETDDLLQEEALPQPGEVWFGTADEEFMESAGNEGINGSSSQPDDVLAKGNDMENSVSGNDMSVEAVSYSVEYYHADHHYFDDALFIGDSRTVGLYEYGNLGNAEVFADSGMSIYKVSEEEFALRNGEKITLDEALQSRVFGKIYVMLGINELGYDFDQTVKKYGELLDRISSLQPDSLLFAEANLHITKEKADQSDLFNNENIDRFNEAVSSFADGQHIFYLDVNPVFDDEEGCLNKEYTSDGAHILGKYYADWAEFILQNAVRVMEE